MIENDYFLTVEEWTWIGIFIILWLVCRFVIFPILFGVKDIIDREIEQEERKKRDDEQP